MNASPVVLATAAVAAAGQFGCASDGGSASTTPTRPVATGRVSSSIPEGAQLSDPVRWTARVTGVSPHLVAHVRFLIDGKVAHIDLQTPYEFTGRGSLLIPAILGRGSHTLAVDARLRGGRRLTAASTATVSLPAHASECLLLTGRCSPAQAASGSGSTPR